MEWLPSSAVQNWKNFVGIKEVVLIELLFRLDLPGTGPQEVLPERLHALEIVIKVRF
jgi:hypothetical protein